MIKIKVIDRFNYQKYPLTKDMVEVNEEDLKDIGFTKQFDLINKCIVDYDNINVIKQKTKEERIDYIKKRLKEISDDLVQVQLGAIIIDIEERKEEFVKLHNELRALEGKSLRDYKLN